MTDPRWPLVVRALACLSLDPQALGGLHLRARAGPVRDAVVNRLIRDLPAPLRLPADLPEDLLAPGIDLTASLQNGRLVHRDGLLARYRSLILPMAERVAPGLAARLGQALDRGRHSVVALDEGDEGERPPVALLDRLAMTLDLDGLRLAEMPMLETYSDRDAITEETAIETLSALSLTLGIGSLRRLGLALRLARVSAQVDGRDTLVQADLSFAIATALLPHATRMPAPEEEEAPPPPEPETDAAQSDTQPDTGLPDGDVLLEAALALLPPDVLHRLATGTVARAQGTGAGARRKGNRRGRPLPARPGRMDGRARIDLIATLRAAAPWQRLRGGGPGQRLRLRSADIHLKRSETRSDRLVIFAVDASGSAAFARLAEVKGAVELLLAEAYARRDHVALVAFRGEGAELLLPPTRSLLRTKRHLSGLPGGGGTPLAAGLRAALDLGLQARGRGMDPAVVVLTDGRPNIALSGTASRSEAGADAQAMARALRTQGMTALIIDTGNRPTPALATLAQTMDAPYLPLPRADAKAVSKTVAAAL